MTAEAPQPIDLIELARNNRLESKRVPQILRLSTEIVARLNRIFEEKQGRELITQEPVHEAAQFSVAGEEPIEVIIYTMKDTKWDRSISGATCFGISLRTQVKDWKLLRTRKEGCWKLGLSMMLEKGNSSLNDSLR